MYAGLGVTCCGALEETIDLTQIFELGKMAERTGHGLFEFTLLVEQHFPNQLIN
jgi:hypothetical protein